MARPCSRLRRLAAAVCILLALIVLPSCGGEAPARVSSLGARGDGPAVAAQDNQQVPARRDGALAEPTALPLEPRAEPTPTPGPTPVPDDVEFSIADPVATDRFASGNADPTGLAQAYLQFRLRDVSIEMGETRISVSPGEAHVAHAVQWAATSPRGNSGGVVLVLSSGTNEFWVSEALSSGIELADLSLTVDAGENELQGFVRSEAPFDLSLAAAVPGGDLVYRPIEEGVGQLEIQAAETPGTWFHILITDDADEPLRITELTTFHDGQTAVQVSMLQRFRNEAIERWVLRFGGGPSQPDEQAAQRGVISGVAALPLSSRIDLGAGLAAERAWAPVGRNDRWVLSRLPFPVEQELRSAGVISEPGTQLELLRLGGGATQPVELLDAVPLGALSPAWITATPSAVYAGRAAGTQSMLVRIDLDSGEAVRLAGPDVQPGVPSGWSVASAEQLELLNSLGNDIGRDGRGLDTDVADHLVTLPPLR